MASLDEGKVAAGLGWFSIGLGLAELLAPRQMAGFIGLRDKGHRENILRLYGLREITAGVGLLSQSNPAPWLWARVAGDALDLASLGLAFGAPDAKPGKLAGATAAVAGVTALDILAAQRSSGTFNGNAPSTSVTATESVTINRSADELYRFWRDFDNLPRFVSYLESVRVIDDKRSHWTLRTLGGKTFEWDAEITHDEPGSRISWRSLQGADIPNSGTVSFTQATGNRGTVVRVQVEYSPPGGVAVAKLSRLLKGEPAGQHIYESLHALKQVLETGEVTRSDASVHRGMHPAQPPQSLGQLAQ
jgi:uncharacterized membrane protein